MAEKNNVGQNILNNLHTLSLTVMCSSLVIIEFWRSDDRTGPTLRYTISACIVFVTLAFVVPMA
jgi:hypothetical protein